jgi:hypothetical protein
MAKRARAPARRAGKKARLHATKKRKPSAEPTKDAADARRCKFSPELEAHGRYLFEETNATYAEIGFVLGIHKTTVPIVAKRLRWRPRVRRPRDFSPVTRILLQAQALEREERAVVQAVPTDGVTPSSAQPEDGDHTPAQSDLVTRLQRAVLNELATVELPRQRLKTEPRGGADAERTARTLSTLTHTLQTLQRLQCAVPHNGSDHDMPADIDEFRRDLARRIEEFVASRTDDGAGEQSVSPDSVDPARR